MIYSVFVAGRGVLVVAVWVALAAAAAAQSPIARLTIEYPAEGSIFPPRITPPLFVWYDAAAASEWLIEVALPAGPASIRVRTPGEPLTAGEIDARCVSPTNRLPELTPMEKTAKSWRPDAETWAAIQQHSAEGPAVLTFTGFAEAAPGRPLSRGTVTLRTSRDPVDAPIFYRDVPLMPSELEKGVIKPLAPNAQPLIAWRLRYLNEPRSRLLLENLHSCANCHSFSKDGRTLGMDLDGPRNDKGLYAIALVEPRMTIANRDVIEWRSFRLTGSGQNRLGFMSQVSPDGQTVATTVNAQYYVANFQDYRFLQVFYPTRGVLAWYDRTTGGMQTLPGADDPAYVQASAVWSPDGRYLVFARAAAREAYPEGRPPARYANDTNETAMQYDLYRIPFNGGRGGRAEPVVGASQNGMSNSFPKVSPDGRWIVYVQARNGQLMRPDGQLYIVPASGGQARRMRCNTPLMNSWHSFSPNGRWMVFASKARSPYTQIYLTHIDEAGVDSPAILVENATAANRAANIPEFVNLTAGGLERIDVPAAEFYRLYDVAWELTEKGDDRASIGAWRQALALNPGDAKANSNLGVVLLRSGAAEEALGHLEKAVAANPGFADAHNNLGLALAGQDRMDEAVAEWRKAVALDPRNTQAWFNLGKAAQLKGDWAGALQNYRAGLSTGEDWAPLMRQTAWLLSACPDATVRNGGEALLLAQRAAKLAGPEEPETLDLLAAAYAEAGRFADAVRTGRRALELVREPGRTALAARVALYEAGRAYRLARP